VSRYCGNESDNVDWIHLAQYRDKWQGVMQHGSEPLGSIRSKKFLDYMSNC